MIGLVERVAVGGGRVGGVGIFLVSLFSVGLWGLSKCLGGDRGK